MGKICGGVFLAVALLFANAALAIGPEHPSEVIEFYCDKFQGDEHHFKRCRVELIVKGEIEEPWKRFACLGEIEWQQLVSGKIDAHRTGYLASIENNGSQTGKKGSFRIASYTHFPTGYRVLDPKHLWVKCLVID
jgi:hypothetical protein